ncbi:MAG: site-specific tyrosine recombinase XerD [Planctomycetaceae bacterium]|nr:site-specific tyrosine recombinase XerD [Planctomycetaceae bacterium]
MPPRKRPPAGSKFQKQVQQDLGRYYDPFLYYLEAECGMAQNTITAYKTDVARFLDWYKVEGPSQINEIELNLFSRYIEHLNNEGLNPTSIARHLISIKMFFRYLVLEGVILESKAELINAPKLAQKLPTVLSPDRVDELLEAPDHTDRYPLRDKAILATLYATGCRVSELTGLKLRDLYLEEAYCRCLGKGNKERIVNLNPRAITAIKKYLKFERPPMTRRNDSGFLFVTRAGNRMTRDVVFTMIKRCARRIGATGNISPHTLRHSFATHMLARGAEIRALQELLGHANIRTTQIYTHVDHTRLKNVHAEHHPRG